MAPANSTTTTRTLDNFTPEARSLVVAAQQLADERKHRELEPIHVLVSVLVKERGTGDVLSRAGADPAEFSAAAERALGGRPTSNEPAYLSVSTLDLLERAEREAERERRAQVNVADVLNALTQELRGAAGELWAAFRIGPGGLRAHMTALRSQPVAAGAVASKVTPHGDVAGSPGLQLLSTKADDAVAVVGREQELGRLLTVLARESKCHPLLVGDAGVGKHALVSALAQRVATGEVPSQLKSVRVLELQPSALAAGSRLRGELEERARKLLTELAQAKDPPVLVIRGLEQLFTANSPLSALADALRPLLERAELRLLATATPEGLRKIEERDRAFLHELTLLEVAEPSEAVALEMLRATSPRLTQHHEVGFDDAAFKAAITLAKRYLRERRLPDSALDLLDETAAKKRVELDRQVKPDSAPAEPARVSAEDVAATLSVWTGIPLQRMLEGETSRLLELEQRLRQRVVGQDHALGALGRAVRRGRMGLRDPRRPIGSFLFLGPSGVGKTELCKALSAQLFDDERALTRLDMSEFMERHMAQRLIGAPPGYADSDQGGFLTEAVRRRPYSVLLFDEVEKAHPDVFNLLLQLLDDGRLTDGRGKTADFSNTVVIMTSNIGSEHVLEAEPARFESEEGRDALRAEMLTRLRQFFRPELLNRIDEVLVFRPLGKEQLELVVELELKQIARLLGDRGLSLRATDAAKARLVELGYEPALGARPLKRTILRHVQDPLAEGLLSGRFTNAKGVVVDVTGESISLSAEPVAEPSANS
ncbi:MAG: ATP-dependent Clp protease ATP-binding subunit [Polyangiaceae bacterium]